jgi:PAS domain S-box-containing protein
MVCTHDLRGNLLTINTHGAEMIGRTVEEMTGHNLAAFLAPDRRDALAAYLKKIGETGEAQGMFHLSHANGEVRDVAYRNKLIVVSGHAPYVLGFGVDISEQVRAESQLRTLTRQSDSILASVGDGIFGIDLEGRITFVNAAATQMLGYKQEEMLGQVMHNLIHHTASNPPIRRFARA